MASCPSGYNLNPENKIKTKKKKIENKKTKKEKGGKGAYLTYNFQKYYIKVCVVFFFIVTGQATAFFFPAALSYIHL